MTQMDSESMLGSSSNNTSTINDITGGNHTPRLIQQYNWYYDKNELKRTPSIVIDNISYEREKIYRNEGARFILNVGSAMKLRYDTLATGVVYFHRFYMQHSFKVFPRYVTAACCLFLAGKAEETPKKCKDIIKVAKGLLDEHEFAAFGEDPREEVLTLERIVLQTIRFDLQVEHPYKYLISYVKCFKGNKNNIKEVLQTAWTFTNDSLCTTICLQWEPEIVAIAMIFLATKLNHQIKDWEGRLPHQKHWWEIYVEDLNVELLEDICHQVLDLYSQPKEEHHPSPPVSSPAQQSIGSNSTTPMNTQPPSFPTPNSVTNIQFRAVRAAAPPSTGPNTAIPTQINLAPTPINATIPSHAQHQWDPNVASFYNYSLVGNAIQNGSYLIGTNSVVIMPTDNAASAMHLVPGAAMGPGSAITIPTIPMMIPGAQPTIPFVPSGINQHQST